jgi:hypothetical protein
MVARRRLWNARNAIGAAAVAVLAAAMATAVSAHAASVPAPTLIQSAVSSNAQSPCQNDPNCSDPGVLVVQGVPFLLTVTLTTTDSSGNTVAAEFSKDTKLTLTSTGTGSLNTTTVTMPANTDHFTFGTVSYSPFANNVTVTAGVGGKGSKTSTIVSTPSNAFDVLQTLKTDPASNGVPFQDGAGPDACTTVSSTNPVCGILVLPHGANSSGVLLSTGSCSGLGCNTKGTVTQFVGDINGLYTRTDPATLIINCYRTVCGQGGVSHLLGLVSPSGQTGALVQAPPCPAKNTIGPDQQYCTDQVQNVRGNADNSLIYILFLDDFKGSI